MLCDTNVNMLLLPVVYHYCTLTLIVARSQDQKMILMVNLGTANTSDLNRSNNYSDEGRLSRPSVVRYHRGITFKCCSGHT